MAATTSKTVINDLPLEIFVNILKYVDGYTLGKCRRVCKKWMECISSEHIWFDACQREFKYASYIAREKASTDCKWYHIYRNMKLFTKLMTFDNKLRKFYEFSLHDSTHVLNIDHGILPLRDVKGIVMYDMSTLMYIPVALPEKTCLKIANTDRITVVQLKSGILVQRSVDCPTWSSEEFFKADDFILGIDVLYYHFNRDVYKVILIEEEITPELILKCDYNIKEIKHYNDAVHLFTDCGKIVTYDRGDTIVKNINCPPEWIKQIKHIRAVNDKNYLCYSRNLFQIETDKYKHLYLEFLPITCLFFYVDNILIATDSGEILLYRHANQKKAIRPIFEKLALLPDGRFATQIDVCERQKGTMIFISTFTDLYVMEFNFYPSERETKKKFSTGKLLMYKRLLKLKERLQDPNSG
ncbi:uncharacterized protein [Epargyreus clarus]|uniref:uncharacterized protein n=1 Tax=Epargyreus clarus TaxID=520877 RepID=UPI003C2AF0C6